MAIAVRADALGRKFAVALLTAAALAASAPAARAEDIPVKVGVTGRPDQAALELAFHRGYFARQGLAVEFVGGGIGGEEYVSALAANRIQVAAGAPNAAVFNAINRGIGLRIVADWSHIGSAADSTFSLVGRADLMRSGALKSAADLKGRTVGVGPSRGSYNEMFIAELLAASHPISPSPTSTPPISASPTGSPRSRARKSRRRS